MSEPAWLPTQPAAPSRRGPSEVRLFRTEVMTERQTQWLGSVMLAPRLSFRVFALVGLGAATAVLALLFLASYTRTARIQGWLLPQQGVVRVHAPRPGMVMRLDVVEGSVVKRGDPLLTLSDETRSTGVGATQARIAQRLEERRASLLHERQSLGQMFAQQDRALASTQEVLQAEDRKLAQDIKLLQERVAIAARTEALHQQQFKDGFISQMRLAQVQSDLIDHRARVASAERARLAASRDQMNLASERAELPIKSGQQIAAIDRAIAEIDQQLAEAEARRELVIAAPQDGTVTAIQAIAGAQADVNTSLLMIVPPGNRLEAQLYGPSQAIGFVQSGQQVKLRYDAYPYQRFGQYPGQVTSVSRAALGPTEVPPSLSALAAIGAAAGNAGGLYRVTVQIDRQNVTAYGEQLPLQAGMTLQADIALERRRLIDWVLDPLYTITGRQPG